MEKETLIHVDTNSAHAHNNAFVHLVDLLAVERNANGAEQ